jgi:AraC-like DNA-binding protein
MADGQATAIPCGSVFIMSPEHRYEVKHHADSRTGRMRFQCAHFRFLMFRAVPAWRFLEMPLQMPADAASEFGHVIGQLLAIKRTPPPTLLENEALRRELAFRVFRILCSISAPNEQATALSAHTNRMIRLTDFLRENIRRQLRIEDVAKAVGLSPSGVHRFFGQVIGQSPMTYVKSQRLTTGCRLLLLSDRTVAEISADVGFANPYHFSREFKRRFGVPPATYRKQHR